MPEPAPDEIKVSARTLIRLVVEVRKVNERLTKLEATTKSAGLNGHSAHIKRLAELAPEIEKRMSDPQMARLTQMVEASIPTMERFISLAPKVIALIEKQDRDQEFRAGLATRTRWLRTAVRAVLAAAGGAVIWALTNHYITKLLSGHP